MDDDKPRLLYGASISRRRYFNRFLRAVIVVLAAAGAYWALDEAARRELADPLLLNLALLTAILLAGLMSVRGLFNLVLALVRRTEIVRFYDNGFVWKRGRTQHKYAWHQLDTYRESARGKYLLKWPVYQSGAHRFTMKDGTTLKFGGRFGDTRSAAEAVRRYAAYVTGTQMGRSLRADQPVRLHRDLILYPGGIASADDDILWSEADVKVIKQQLIVRRLDAQGQELAASRYPLHEVDNVGGLLELMHAMTRIYRPTQPRKPS